METNTLDSFPIPPNQNDTNQYVKSKIYQSTYPKSTPKRTNIKSQTHKKHIYNVFVISTNYFPQSYTTMQTPYKQRKDRCDRNSFPRLKYLESNKIKNCRKNECNYAFFKKFCRFFKNLIIIMHNHSDR